MKTIVRIANRKAGIRSSLQNKRKECHRYTSLLDSGYVSHNQHVDSKLIFPGEELVSTSTNPIVFI
jgi:hypothetical protein